MFQNPSWVLGVVQRNATFGIVLIDGPKQSIIQLARYMFYLLKAIQIVNIKYSLQFYSSKIWTNFHEM